MSLSVDQALRRAERHARRGEVGLAAQKYKRVLQKDPQNQRAIAGLQELQQPKAVRAATNAGPCQQQINELIALYSRGKLQQTLVQGEVLSKNTRTAIRKPTKCCNSSSGMICQTKIACT